MHTAPFSLNDLADFLHTELAAERYADAERGGIYYPSNRLIKRIGLALDPFPKLADWVSEKQIDTLWLHRPWQINLENLPADIGIMTHHLPFDETLTMGYNPQLAKALGAIGELEPLGYKQDMREPGKPLPQRPIGMLMEIAPQEFDQFLASIKTIFGGYDRAEAGHGPGAWQSTSYRIAVVGAMTDALVREAASKGANLYITGTYRKPGQQAIDATGSAFIAVGHRRSEVWGLQALADLLHERYGVDCIVHEPTIVSKL
ncbi:Nif3-like dinuclear metal center hexameric protein [Spirosoma foliorum]|uniref:Nif3-like dinuclear metal center hexameric protein n=1 Tax=Spirosoma foliorum TaxID=2710596 RepID=A0A7G5GR75_9BACT|nr:Nif3-like dinuclear metal center hexameric protein [Spirosoma foliorum]QMW01367.1 Nif3-like dinuclear metal center hexameric protein [Spirosoma foliorum]